MSEPKTATQRICYECGASIAPDDANVAKCWLCGGNRIGDTSSRNAEPPSPSPPTTAGQQYSFSLQTLMLTISLLVVCFGMFRLFPGLCILMMIALAPALVRTTLVVRRRETKGQTVSRPVRIALLAGSFATAMTVLVVVQLAAVGTFLVVCATGEFDADGLRIALIAAGFATLFSVLAMGWWIRARWRRDTQI